MHAEPNEFKSQSDNESLINIFRLKFFEPHLRKDLLLSLLRNEVRLPPLIASADKVLLHHRRTDDKRSGSSVG